MDEYRELASRYYAHLEMLQHGKEVTIAKVPAGHKNRFEWIRDNLDKLI